MNKDFNLPPTDRTELFNFDAKHPTKKCACKSDNYKDAPCQRTCRPDLLFIKRENWQRQTRL